MTKAYYAWTICHVLNKCTWKIIGCRKTKGHYLVVSLLGQSQAVFGDLTIEKRQKFSVLIRVLKRLNYTDLVERSMYTLSLWLILDQL